MADRAGLLDPLIAAIGCAICFTAITRLVATVGLGLLGQREGLVNNTLPLLFAWVALVINALSWVRHRQWHRSMLGMLGPTHLLLSLYP